MPDLYRIPCSCGKKISVEARQAGRTLTCECGAEIEVPTLRQLAKLAERESGDQAPARTWGGRSRFVLFGLVLASVGLAWVGYSLVTRPAAPKPTLSQSLLLWHSLTSRRAADALPEPWKQYDQAIAVSELHLRQGLITLVIGLAVAACALLLPMLQRPTPQRERPSTQGERPA